MEYVKERAKLCDLTRAVRAWERKVEISEVLIKMYGNSYTLNVEILHSFMYYRIV